MSAPCINYIMLFIINENNIILKWKRKIFSLFILYNRFVDIYICKG